MLAPSTNPESAIASLPVARLVDEARAGSAESLAELFKTARARMMPTARRDLPTAIQGKVGASDIVQDAVFQAHRRFEDFRGQSAAEFYGWLRCILRHTMIDHLRRFQMAEARTVRREIPLQELFGHHTEAVLPGNSRLPEGSAIRREDAAALEQAIELLAEDARLVIRLRHWEGRGFDDIAECVGKSEAAVRKIWYRALQRLGEIVRSTPALCPSRDSHVGTAADDDAGIRSSGSRRALPRR
jgi:RNA polymerase sigma-70 factor (ECF subfamily)